MSLYTDLKTFIFVKNSKKNKSVSVADLEKSVLADLSTVQTSATTSNLGTVLANGGTATSLALKNVISDETGSGALVFASSPTLVSPVLGFATFTALNSVLWSAPASPVQISFTSGSTLTFQGTDTYVGRATTDTLTNKRITKRVQINAGGGNATLPILIANYDIIRINNQAGTISLTQPAATPDDGDVVIYQLKDNGVARAISYASGFRGIVAALPTITIAGKIMYLTFMWNSVDSKWDLMSLVNEV